MATSNKYDRQLRLWGAEGQASLGACTVVLIRATAAGTETCKNLILPGIGRFVVVDDAATASSAGCRDDQLTCHASNFFLASTDNNTKSNSRAEKAMSYLQELNPDVKGSFEHVSDGLGSLDMTAFLTRLVVEREQETGGGTIMVLASDLEPPLLEKVSAACGSCSKQNGGSGATTAKDVSISCVAVWSYGLLGAVRVQQTRAIALLHPKPRDSPPDLRLVRPFDGLTAMYRDPALPLNDPQTWTNMTNQEHGHVPYPLVLMHVMERYKQERGGRVPSTFAEKQDFTARIKAFARNVADELNFAEAVKNAYLAYAGRTVDREHLQQIKESSGGGVCPVLERLITALFAFMDANEQQVPLAGNIPDMTASTAAYVQLQKTYQTKAEEDWKAMRALLPPEAGGEVVVSDADLTAFIRNVHDVALYSTRTLVQEPDIEILEDLNVALAEAGDEERPDQTPLLWYWAFCAAQEFYRQHSRYPGVVVDRGQKYEDDVPLLRDCLETVLERFQVKEQDLIQKIFYKGSGDNGGDNGKGAIPLDHAVLREVTRWGNAEIHNIAAVVGGVASQEAVKLITGQYVPMDNTYVFNGIASVAAVYRL